MDVVLARYRIPGTLVDVERRAADLALEQTVEIPEALVQQVGLKAHQVGQIRQILPLETSEQLFEVEIAFPADFASGGLGQLSNLLFGNISLKPELRLTAVELPPCVLSQYQGPRFGVPGLRQLLGIQGRPLLATALKPRGVPVALLANWAREFALGGGDLIKDDHNLVEPHFEAFLQRVNTCQAAIHEAEQTLGRAVPYLPNLAGPADQMPRRIEACLKLGVTGFLVAPFLVGLDTLTSWTATYPAFWLAHPTFAGGHLHSPQHGMEASWLLGTLFRLAGCDGTIFPNSGGRFSFTPQTCQEISAAARNPLGHFPAIWPSPAGGMSYDRLPMMAEQYGADALFLIGGALLNDPAGLQAATRRYRDSLGQLFPDAQEVPPEGFSSACEWRPRSRGTNRESNGLATDHLRFLEGFQWKGRSRTAYKETADLPFKGVERTELIGQFGEQADFDLRYFEIGPSGHSSLEKHVHTHVIIGARGQGHLRIEGETRTIRPFDIAYVPPLQVHQLLNENAEPFGFFCIVDRQRDKPQPP